MSLVGMRLFKTLGLESDNKWGLRPQGTRLNPKPIWQPQSWCPNHGPGLPHFVMPWTDLTEVSLPAQKPFADHTYQRALPAPPLGGSRDRRRQLAARHWRKEPAASLDCRHPGAARRHCDRDPGVRRQRESVCRPSENQ